MQLYLADHPGVHTLFTPDDLPDARTTNDIDLLAAPLGRFAERVPKDSRRVKPRPSVKLHASKLEEAVAAGHSVDDA